MYDIYDMVSYFVFVSALKQPHKSHLQLKG